MQTKKILFIGGPSTGKTSVIEKLKQQGYCCFDEISREVTLKAQKEGISQLFLEQPLLFSQKLLEGRIAQFEKATESKKNHCFIDRGIPDVGAYMAYKNEHIPEAFSQANHAYLYDQVFIFPLWKDIYISDNERYESYEEAEEIQLYLKKTYEGLGYNLIEIPKVNVEERVKFILKKSKDANTK